MTVQIAPIGGVILMVALAVGYFIYKHERQRPTGRGDVVAAIGCATAALTALLLVFGGGDKPAPQIQAPAGGGAAPVPTFPASGP
ncbi:hypothetical protein [Streptomyces sp. NPDC095817]|uniref:hypothetical protein n=1 Tax=Streptomyces sp. NPDC095817 TaxID=3155082 RepID=UPI00332A93C6